AAWAGTSGIEEEHSVPPLDSGLVGMSRHDDVELHAEAFGIFHVVDEQDLASADRDLLPRGNPARPAAGGVVAAHRDERRERRQLGQYLRRADVARMKNQPTAA